MSYLPCMSHCMQMALTPHDMPASRSMHRHWLGMEAAPTRSRSYLRLLHVDTDALQVHICAQHAVAVCAAIQHSEALQPDRHDGPDAISSCRSSDGHPAMIYIPGQAAVQSDFNAQVAKIYLQQPRHQVAHMPQDERACLAHPSSLVTGRALACIPHVLICQDDCLTAKC